MGLLKAAMRGYMSFTNKYYTPVMYGMALRKTLRSVDSDLVRKQTSSSQILKEIEREKQFIINSEITKQFLQKEALQRNIDKMDDSWLPFIAKYMASIRVIGRELFENDERKAMMLVHDRALLPPIQTLLKVVLSRVNMFKTPKKGEEEKSVDVLQYMWKIMTVANDLMQTWVLSHQIYNEQVSDESIKSSSNVTSEVGEIHVSSIKVHDCMLNRFFKSHSATHMMPVICSFDAIWARNAFEKTGYKFRRNQTLSLGGEHCAFDFSKGFNKSEDDVVLEELKNIQK